MGAVVDLLADYGVAGLTHEGITVVRTHIRMNFGYATAADVWSWGLSVVRLTDIGTQSPQPALNPLISWMMNVQEQPTATGAAVDVLKECIYDVKSRRKIHEPGSTLGLCLTNGTAAARTVQVQARVLMALP